MILSRSFQIMKTFFALLVSAIPFAAALASDFKAGDLTIGHPWTWSTPPGAKVGAAFFELANKGKAADRLLSASSPIAGTTELHTHANEAGVMKMRAVNAIDVAPGASVSLKPGGFHVMFFDLKKPMAEGEKFPVELVFEKAGKTTIQVHVEKRGAHKHDHAGHKH